jgi:hypothetical protein
MQTVKRLFVIMLVSISIVSCSKDDDTNDNIVARKGLPLAGDQEVPVRTTTASGTLDVSYDKTTRMLTYTVNWNGLSTNPTGSHIHGSAARGVNAGIKHDFFSLIPKTMSGTFTNSFMVDGVAIKEDSLLNGFYYMNFHTTTYPGGEIRGQIEFK